MRGVNKVIIIGNLGADPDIKQFNNGGMVATISVATSEKWNDKQTGEPRENTEWHRIVFNNRLAEIAAQYLKKGSSVYVEGSLRTRKYQDQTGQDRYITEIRADNLQMLGNSPAGQMNQNNLPAYPNTGYPNHQNNYPNNAYNQGYNQNSGYQNQGFANPNNGFNQSHQPNNGNHSNHGFGGQPNQFGNPAQNQGFVNNANGFNQNTQSNNAFNPPSYNQQGGNPSQSPSQALTNPPASQPAVGSVPAQNASPSNDGDIPFSTDNAMTSPSAASKPQASAVDDDIPF